MTLDQMRLITPIAAALLTLIPVAGNPQSDSGTSPAALAEEVIFVPLALSTGEARLETTVYRPSASGPWPLAVINHGAAGYAGPSRQRRYRPVAIARFFLERGYLVVAPMRQGFSKSTGTYAWNCDHETYARRYAGDVAAVINYFVKSGQAQADRVLVVGQSNGGMVALGYAAEFSSVDRRARAIINFAGGINSSRPNCDWRNNMISAARSLGAKTDLPSLWIYAEDDPIFPPSVSKPFFDAYHSGNRRSFLKLYHTGGHNLSNLPVGSQIWISDIEQFLREVGLPW